MLEFHSIFAWTVVFLNALAGFWALTSVRVARLRVPALWWTVIAAQAVVCIQVVAGVVLQATGDRKATEFHIFYGVGAVVAIGIAWMYAQGSEWVKERREMFYGLVCLFLMGMALRAMQQANAL